MRGESAFWSEVSEVVAGDHGGVDVWWGQPEVLFQFPPQVEGRRIRVGLEALKNAEERTEGRRPLRVDLRYGEKVFLDWSPADFDRTGDDS